MLILIFCRAAFHSNYDSYNNIQKIPEFLKQEMPEEERRALKMNEVKEYLRDYQKDIHLATESVLNPKTQYYFTNELNRERLFWFKLYFWMDFSFMLLLSCVLFIVLRKSFLKKDDSNFQLNKMGKIFLVLCGMSILFDVAENLCMLTGAATFKMYNVINVVKEVLIISVLLCWFKNFHKLYFKKFTYSILRAVGACFISLLVIILVLVLLTQMAQGITLVIDLFTSPINSIIFLFFVAFTSILLSHFPVYLYIRLFESDKFQWIWSRRFWIPVIYYNRISDSNPNQENRQSTTRDLRVFTFLRHYIGNFFLLMVLYAFIFSWNKTSYRIPLGIINEVFAITAFLLGIFQNSLLKLKIKVRLNEITDSVITKFFYIFNCYEGLLMLSFVSLIGRFWLVDWNLTNKIYTSSQLLIILCTYIMFRELRGLLKYKYGLSQILEKSEPNYNFKSAPKNTVQVDEKYLVDGYMLISDSTNKSLWKRKKQIKFPLLGNFSNNVYYLYSIALFGTLSSVIVIVISFFGTVSIINGANYLLVFLMLYYSLFITIVKCTFYGENKGGKNLHISKKMHDPNLQFESFVRTAPLGFPLKYTGFASIILGIVLIFFFKSGNDLHLLKPIDTEVSNESQTPIDGDQFLARFQESSTSDTIYAISAFGGGLKANYNTLRTLQTIQEKTDGKFLENTISMSGVSGGGLGLANYYLMHNYMKQEKNQIEENISQIGDLDIVSIDIPYFLFVDLLRSIIPKNEWIWNGIKKYGWDKDRSQVAMKRYRDIIAPNLDLDSKPYQKIHHDIFSRGEHAPALLMNTTSTRLKYGVASTVEVGTFPGAINILKAPSLDTNSAYTLNFYDAVSTINRFPFLSPAAKIKNTGHFVDGGYFENSGILTSISFLDLVSNHQWSSGKKLDINGSKKKVVIVNFLNSKLHWINHLLSDTLLSTDGLRVREKQSSETSSVIGTVTGTEMLPNFFVEALKNKSEKTDSTFGFITFYIPYKVSMEDVEQYLDAESMDNESVRNKILINNARIDSILINSKLDLGYNYKQWGAVEPALARVLSTPDKIYQDAMIKKHPYILRQIGTLR